MNLDQTLATLNQLSAEEQRALQMEVASLTEARSSTQRAIDTLNGEMEALGAKLSALRAALSLLRQGNVTHTQRPPVREE